MNTIKFKFYIDLYVKDFSCYGLQCRTKEELEFIKSIWLKHDKKAKVKIKKEKSTGSVSCLVLLHFYKEDELKCSVYFPNTFTAEKYTKLWNTHSSKKTKQINYHVYDGENPRQYKQILIYQKVKYVPGKLRGTGKALK
jgi:hypothetical protein